jgi:predicted O-methyltransferase YrrM
MIRRATWRRFALGLPTILGVAKRGFFIPYRYAETVPPAGGSDLYPAVAKLFSDYADIFAEALAVLADYDEDYRRILADHTQGAPRFDQDWFPRLDAAMTYALVRRFQPRRIIEVGSGHSTRFVARAVADGKLATAITAIDPAPRADIAALPITLLRDAVPHCGRAPFESLQPGDLLMIDSSHILMPGTDVDFLLSSVLPTFKPGTLVHIHDMMLPDDYPADWAWRGYNEQPAVAALLGSGVWQPLFSSHWAVTRMAPVVAKSAAAGLPLPAGARESGLWLERRGRGQRTYL